MSAVTAGTVDNADCTSCVSKQGNVSNIPKVGWPVYLASAAARLLPPSSFEQSSDRSICPLKLGDRYRLAANSLARSTMRCLSVSATSISPAPRQWVLPPRCCCSAAAVGRGGMHSSVSSHLVAAAQPNQPVAVSVAASLLLLWPGNAAHAHIAIDQLPQAQQQQQLQKQPVIPGSTAGFDPSAVGNIRASKPAPPSSSRNRTRQQSVTATEALEALQQLRTAELQFKQGDYAAALQGYTAVVKQHPDLALTEYARLGQALCMYQEGSTSQALTELNELELDLRGNPETHAALAAVLYAERPAQRWRAEQQWDIALDFDSRYQDLVWVRDNQHWPPRLMGALERFLNLG